MTNEGNPWEEKSAEEYFAEGPGPAVKRSGTEYPTDMGREAWLLENVPGIGPQKARALLRRYGIVAKIPHHGNPEQVVASVSRVGWGVVHDLQSTLKQWKEEDVIQGIEYDSKENPRTKINSSVFS